MANVTSSTASNVSTTPVVNTAAVSLLQGAQGVSEMVYQLPHEDFIVTHSLTSNNKPRIVIESVNNSGVGAINLFHNVDPEVLAGLIPEDVYTAGTLNLYFKPSASAGSETCYNFQFYPNQNVAEKLLSMKNQTAQVMQFPAKKAQLNGAQAALATSINRGNTGRAVVEAANSGIKESVLTSMFKGLLG